MTKFATPVAKLDTCPGSATASRPKVAKEVAKERKVRQEEERAKGVTTLKVTAHTA